MYVAYRVNTVQGADGMQYYGIERQGRPNGPWERCLGFGTWLHKDIAEQVMQLVKQDRA